MSLSALELATEAPARAITVRAAPLREPPFDDELIPVNDGRGRRNGVAVGVLGEQHLPLELWPRASPATGHHRSWATAVTEVRGDLPDPAGWARRLFVALLEARAGLRPLRQLGGYLSPAVNAGLALEFARLPERSDRAAVRATRPRPPTVTSIHVCEPADSVAEVCAVICTGTRYRAIAARLEVQDGRWRCVRLQFG